MDFFDGLIFPAAGTIQVPYFRAHTPLYYGIQYNHIGKMRLQINDNPPQSFEAPVCFITHPLGHFEYELYGEAPHEYLYFCFTGARVQKYLEAGLLDLSSAAMPIQHFHKFYETMRELLRLRQLNRYSETVNLLENLLLQLKHKQYKDQRFFQRDDLQRLIQELRLHPEKSWNFEQEAKRMNVSRAHFWRLFRRLTEDSPHHFLLQQRLEKATQLLAHSDDSIATVAIASGFDDIFHFSAIFKKYYGISPLKYRKEFFH